MSVTLEISDDLVESMRSHPHAARVRLQLELAIALYREGRFPVGRAAELAGLEQSEFEAVLRQRSIPIPYSLSDLEHDFAYASGGR